MPKQLKLWGWNFYIMLPQTCTFKLQQCKVGAWQIYGFCKLVESAQGRSMANGAKLTSSDDIVDITNVQNTSPISINYQIRLIPWTESDAFVFAQNTSKICLLRIRAECLTVQRKCSVLVSSADGSSTHWLTQQLDFKSRTTIKYVSAKNAAIGDIIFLK